MTTEEIHPFYEYINVDNKNLRGGFIPFSTKILIIGTFPPEAEYKSKGDGFFFYSSSRNQFFNRIDNIFGEDPGYVRLKKHNSLNLSESFIDNRIRKENSVIPTKIGFIDVFTKVQRVVKDSSQDRDLVPVENGMLKEIIRYNGIISVCCVYDLAYQVLKKELIKVAEQVKVVPDAHAANLEKLLVNLESKVFEVILLYAATRSRQKGLLKDEQYKRYLFENVRS